jgi:hypothetical protein
LLDLNRGTLIAAAGLCAVGSVVGLIGVTLAAVAVIGDGRRWYRRADLPLPDFPRTRAAASYRGRQSGSSPRR